MLDKTCFAEIRIAFWIGIRVRGFNRLPLLWRRLLVPCCRLAKALQQFLILLLERLQFCLKLLSLLLTFLMQRLVFAPLRQVLIEWHSSAIVGVGWLI